MHKRSDAICGQVNVLCKCIYLVTAEALAVLDEIDPLSPNSDKHLISPYNVTT